MSFLAGAIIAKAILDTSQWVSGSKTMQKGFSTLSKIGVAAVAAITAGLIKSIMSADEWQKEFANVTTLVDESQVSFIGMAKELLSLDSRLGSSTDLTRGLYQALSASVEPSKAVQFVGEAAKFAKAALVDTNTAVDVITTGLNAYGLEANKATDISDKLFSVIKLGKTTGDELSATIGQSIPLAANMGISFDELGASIAVMTRQGINASASTTQFNAVVNAFLKPSEDMKNTLHDIGFESGEAAIQSLGFKGALDRVIETTGGSKEETAKLFRNVRALKGVLALTGTGASDYADVLDEITNSTGATEIAFNKQEITFETLKNTLGKGSIIIGNIGKIFADELAVGATKAAEGMIQFLVSSQGAELVSTIIAGLATIFETLKNILQPFVETVLTELNSIWDTLTGTLSKVFSETEAGVGIFHAFSVSVQLASSGIRILSTIIQGVITNIGNFITAIQKSGDTIGTFFDFLTLNPTWEEVESKANAAGKAFANFGTGVATSFTDTVNTIIGEVSTFQDRVNQQANNLELKYTTTFDNVKTNSLNNYDSIFTGQQNFSDLMIENYKKLMTGMGEATDETTLYIDLAFAKTTQDVIDAFARARIGTKENLDGMEEDTKTTTENMEDLWTGLQDAVESGFSTMFMVIGEGLVTTEEGTKSLGETFVDTVKDMISKALEALGQWLFAQGVASFPNPPVAVAYFAASALAFATAGIVRGLQEGGPVYPNEPVLVGERGPELFIPGSSGYVYNNRQTNDMLRESGITINNYNNIANATDAEILSQKLAVRLKSARKAI